MKEFKLLLWGIAFLGSGFGGLVTFIFSFKLNDTPQEVILMGTAFAVIPYCFARAVSEILPLITNSSKLDTSTECSRQSASESPEESEARADP